MEMARKNLARTLHTWREQNGVKMEAAAENWVFPLPHGDTGKQAEDSLLCNIFHSCHNI